MKVSAGRPHGAVAKGGLDQVDRRAAIEGVRSVTVSEPMGAHWAADTGSFGGPAEDYANAPAVQRLSTATPEDRFVRLCGSTPADEFGPYLGGQRNRSGPAVLAEDRNLASIASSM